MATRFTGGCICGGVRYECAADSIAMGNCDCHNARRASGGRLRFQHCLSLRTR